MTVCRVTGYTTLGLMSCGVSQAVGIVGLFFTAIKSIYDKAMLEWAKSKEKANASNHLLKAQYSNKVRYYDKRLKNDETYAKLCGMMLIPFIGGPLAYKKGNFGDFSGASTDESLSSTQLGQNLARIAPFPLSTRKINLDSDKTEFLEQLPQAAATKIKTTDNREIDAVWIAGEGTGKTKGCTVILHHGNGMTLYSMTEWAKWFNKRGMNVLAVTMGGYPGSSQEPTRELTTYHDAQSALNKAKELTGKSDNGLFLSYGISMGGSLALFAGANNPGMHVITDQTFDQISNVPANILPEFLTAIGKGVMAAACPIETDGVFTTDGLSNTNKVKNLKGGSYLALAATGDRLMTTSKGKNLTENLLNEYLISHPELTQNGYRERMLVKFPGSHACYFGDNDQASKAVEHYLKRIGFM